MSRDEQSSIEALLRELEIERFALHQASAELAQHRRLVQDLGQAIRSRDSVLSIVAHDLRNPVHVILLTASRLLNDVSNRSSRQAIERIVRSARRAERMLSGLLETRTLDSGALELEQRPIQTEQLIFDAIDSQFAIAGAASVLIGSDLSANLPAMNADKERLMEVLENLIGNAIKFTAIGGSVTVGAARADDELVVWVKDNGLGIAPEQLPHIFERFWQAKPLERRGTGLGLSICKRTVEAHGGRIWAESALGVGTTLFFTVPIAFVHRTEVPSIEIESVLLVDSRAEDLLALEAILERPDYRLVKASTGREALELARHEHFAVALIDLAMQGTSGAEIAERLKQLELGRDVPIVFTTARGEDPKEVFHAYSAGGTDYLSKPLDIELVRKKVAVFVALSRRRRLAHATS